MVILKKKKVLDLNKLKNFRFEKDMISDLQNEGALLSNIVLTVQNLNDKLFNY